MSQSRLKHLMSAYACYTPGVTERCNVAVATTAGIGKKFKKGCLA